MSERGTAIVTGGTKGLGLALSTELVSRGWRVLALYKSDDDAAAALASSLPGARAFRHDVTTDPSPLVAELGDGALLLVNNASHGFSPKPFHTVAWDDVAAQLDVGVKGPFQLAKAFTPHMIKRGGGTIVNISTVAAKGLPPKGFAPYVIAKHALEGAGLALAAEYGSRGVKVFGVAPSFMDTPLTAAWDPRMRDMIRAASKTHAPADVARFVCGKVDDTATPGQGETYWDLG